MQFYKIYGELTANVLSDDDRRGRRELARKIEMKTAEFNSADVERYCFVSELEEDYLALGVIVTQSAYPFPFAEGFIEHVGLQAKLESPDEVTFESMQGLLHNACCQSYIDDDNKILERFGLDRICGRRGRGIEFGENLVNLNVKEEELISSAKKLFANETLVPELARIYAGNKNALAHGHPVHYMVEADNRDTRREIYKVLLDALYANRRLANCRYTFLDFRPGEIFSRMSFDALYKICKGGAVVVRYFAGDDSEEGANASSETETIEFICEMAKRYRNEVLTVLCLPCGSNRAKAQFYENLSTLAFVELKEDFISGAAAKEFLTLLAKKHHVRFDKKLFENIDEERSYLAAELQNVFDDWYNQKLKTAVYPQYKDFTTVQKEVTKAKPQGTAYDELFEMIGLTDAKAVIKKALNYYKMQSLYEQKGVKRNSPAMHMIFSGNPGTAKTTVARLFARIMRENSLLSRGHLIEVGRGDLVGKYVGWTAQIVKAKFKEAMGGVLFIDEAYSLVEDRGGSYGDEAINTIVQEMENRRADVVVIFAGYTDRMEGFLAKNPGLRSRIAFHVPFADYDNEELCQIADMISRKNGMKIDKGAYDKLAKAFDIAKANEDFGNGRYVRNMFEQAKMNQASRLLEKDFDDITADDITTITADDIVIPEAKKAVGKRIGFC